MFECWAMQVVKMLEEAAGAPMAEDTASDKESGSQEQTGEEQKGSADTKVDNPFPSHFLHYSTYHASDADHRTLLHASALHL